MHIYTHNMKYLRYRQLGTDRHTYNCILSIYPGTFVPVYILFSAIRTVYTSINMSLHVRGTSEYILIENKGVLLLINVVEKHENGSNERLSISQKIS